MGKPRAMKMQAVLPVCLLLGQLGFGSADDSNHKYSPGEEVKVWANKVGPYHNPQESYLYHSLPFCRPSKREQKARTLGDALEGNTLLNTGISLQFRSDVSDNKDTERVSMCTVELKADSAASFEFAISRQYWYQLYVDELPVWAMVGESTPSEAGSDEPWGLLLCNHCFCIWIQKWQYVCTVTWSRLENGDDVNSIGFPIILAVGGIWAQCDCSHVSGHSQCALQHPGSCDSYLVCHCSTTHCHGHYARAQLEWDTQSAVPYFYNTWILAKKEVA